MGAGYLHVLVETTGTGSIVVGEALDTPTIYMMILVICLDQRIVQLYQSLGREFRRLNRDTHFKSIQTCTVKSERIHVLYPQFRFLTVILLLLILVLGGHYLHWMIEYHLIRSRGILFIHDRYTLSYSQLKLNASNKKQQVTEMKVMIPNKDKPAFPVDADMI